MSNGCENPTTKGNCQKIIKFEERVQQMVGTVAELQGNHKQTDKAVAALQSEHAETRVYMKQVLERLDKLEDKILDKIVNALSK
ncbi:hypothetical protein LPY66_16020 [Dehalobacter sp. DCM]|uniref:hypothetical protein n=1 Tax=Dehalobacter sp. DCM TaxID=2907827 RepID=UPI0030816B76|nr:hypothetical protein LPY66_16020 [Dehalobacter sp. DCM]